MKKFTAAAKVLLAGAAITAATYAGLALILPTAAATGAAVMALVVLMGVAQILE